METINDKSIWPFGKYKGYTMSNVPANYLLWAYNNLKIGAGLKKYIDSKKKRLEIEMKLNNQNIRR